MVPLDTDINGDVEDLELFGGKYRIYHEEYTDA